MRKILLHIAFLLIGVTSFAQGEGFIKAKTLYQEENYQEALKAINNVLLQSKSDSAYFLQGLIYTQLKNNDNALKSFSNALQIDVAEDYFINRGEIYLTLKEYKKAIYDFSQALDINANNSNTYYLSGMAKYKVADRKGACYDWYIAFQKGHTDSYVMFEKRCR